MAEFLGDNSALVAVDESRTGGPASPGALHSVRTFQKRLPPNNISCCELRILRTPYGVHQSRQLNCNSGVTNLVIFGGGGGGLNRDSWQSVKLYGVGLSYLIISSSSINNRFQCEAAAGRYTGLAQMAGLQFFFRPLLVFWCPHPRTRQIPTKPKKNPHNSRPLFSHVPSQKAQKSA
jgi:hypothetical protein